MTGIDTCHVSETSGNIITCKGKLFFAKYLYEGNANDKGKVKYNLEICFKPDADLIGLKNAMGKIALENCDGDADQARNFVNKRFIDPNNKPGNGKPAGKEFKDWVLIRASSDDIPDFVLPSGKRIIDHSSIKGECYSGRWARVTLNPYWLDMKTKEGMIIKGLFLGLQNVQLLDHDTPIGFVKPEGAEEFGAVEGITGDAPAITEDTTTAPATGGGQVDALFG